MINNLTCLKMHGRKFAALLSVAVLTGCSAPALVQGVVASEDYVIMDNNPALRLIGNQMHVVLSEEDGETLRVLTLEVPDTSVVPLGETVELGAENDDGKPNVTVSQGVLVETFRSDGARILSSEANTFYEVQSGTLTIHDIDETVNGEFSVELADGGHLEGSFSLPRQ